MAEALGLTGYITSNASGTGWNMGSNYSGRSSGTDRFCVLSGEE